MKAIACFNSKTDNGIYGSVEFIQQNIDSPTKIVFNLKGLYPYKTYAIHIHEFGDLSEGCKSLGTHFNPTDTFHFHSELGHVGDMINNIFTDRNGEFYYEYFSYRISLYINSIIGRSIVIHKFPDDCGLKGINLNSTFIPYEKMSTKQLIDIIVNLGYDVPHVRKNMIQKLVDESITTGNASTRIAGAVIGLSRFDIF